MVRSAIGVLFLSAGCAATHPIDDDLLADAAGPGRDISTHDELCPGASFETVAGASTYCTYSWPNASCPPLVPNTKNVRCGTLCSNAPFPEVPASVCEELGTRRWVWGQGALWTTDVSTDVSVVGENLFFAVEDPKVGIALTRAGRLLVNSKAQFVTDHDQRLLFRQLRGEQFVTAAIDEDAVRINIDSAGGLTVIHADDSQSALGRIALARVDDPTTLTRIAPNLFLSPTPMQWLSYDEQRNASPIVSGALEEQWDFCE